VIAKQKFDVLSVVAHGDALALEVLWTGTLAVAAGTRKAGSEVRVHSAMFFEFAGGRIARQRNYDCFEEW
jgi:ketosteroid isomerase-like protein